MLPVISPEEAALLDSSSSVPVETLMDRAGWAVARAASAMGAGYGRRIVILAGPGNNGGDGYVAARYLRKRGAAVSVQALAPPKSPAAVAAKEAATSAGVMVGDIGQPNGADLVIDALFGGGFHGGLPPQIKPWLEQPAPVLAIDFPSGLDPATGEVAEQAFTADLTVTFHALKTGHLVGEGPSRCGRVEVADIGLQGGEPSFRLAEEVDAQLPGRARTAHKWSAGSVMVVGGDRGMTGAAVLAGRAALHFGAGAVGLAVPEEQRPVVASLAPELLNFSIADAPGRFQVLVVGPGLGRACDHEVHRLLGQHQGPVIVDADGINAITMALLAARTGPTVITPHGGEFKSLTGKEPRLYAPAQVAGQTAATVLLKGNPTFVTDGGTPWIVNTGGPELATIGTGDVLSGMIAALCARGLAPIEAALSAAYWHGRAGADLAGVQTVTADRLATHIGRFAW